jgi:SNF2 family DNA or RNA helicase
LHDSRLSATWLLSQGYDIVVVTYEFLETSLRPVQAFKSDIEAYVNATRAGRKKAPLPKRPTSALFSPLWKVIQRPWKRTILDEAQNASKRFGKRHQGILHLPTTAIACLSGTAAHNKWTAFSGYLNFMKAIPWTSHSQFMRTFCGSGANPDTPGFIETRLLQRMLQNTLVARPLDSHAASKLHGLVCWAVRFSLDDYDSELVRTFTSKYKEETAKQASSGYGYSDQGRKRDGDSNAAMGWASKARCAAAHPLLLAEIPMKEKRKDRASASGAQKAKPRLEKPRMKEKEDIGGQERQYWLQLVERDQFLEQHSARIRAALAAYKWCRQQYPDEKIAMCSLSLKFLDILAVVLKRRYGIDAVRFDGTTPALKRKLLLRKVETGSADVPLLMTAGCGEFTSI